MARIFESICAEDEYKLLREGCRKALAQYAAGEIKSGEFVRDTMDGKPAQNVKLSGDAEGDPIETRGEINIRLVRPEKPPEDPHLPPADTA